MLENVFTTMNYVTGIEFCVLVFILAPVHEVTHYAAAKLLGVTVKKISWYSIVFDATSTTSKWRARAASLAPLLLLPLFLFLISHVSLGIGLSLVYISLPSETDMTIVFRGIIKEKRLIIFQRAWIVIRFALTLFLITLIYS